MNMHERMAAGKLFTDMCEGLPEERSEAKRRMIALNSTTPDTLEERMRLIKEIFMEGSGAETAWIEPPLYFCYGRHIKLGNGVYINFNCNFVDDGIITIGDGVMFGPNVTIATVGHPLRPDMREYMFCENVTIGNNAWIGESATICPGVTIGENSVIGAGSVVTKDIPANCIAVGNPARVLREINEHDMEYYAKDRRFADDDLEEESRLSAGIPGKTAE